MRSSGRFFCKCHITGNRPKFIGCSPTEFLCVVRDVAASLLDYMGGASLFVIDDPPREVPFSPCLVVWYTWETSRGFMGELCSFSDCVDAIRRVKRSHHVHGLTVRMLFNSRQEKGLLRRRDVPKMLMYDMKSSVQLPPQYTSPMVIGQTDLSTVYCSECIATGMPVIIKIPSSHLTTKLFEREVYFCTRFKVIPGVIRAESIVQVKVWNETRVGIVFKEYDRDMHKMSLISSKGVLSLLSGVLFSLQYLHAYGVVHRDIKPSNILMNKFGFDGPVLCDLATMRFVHDKLPENDETIPKSLCSNSLTSGCLGTYVYQPPEALVSRNVLTSPKSDIWSLGVTILEIHNDMHPFMSKKDIKDCRFQLNDYRLYVLGKMHKAYEQDGQLSKIEKHMLDIGIDVELKRLIMSMIDWLPENRPTAREAFIVCEEIAARIIV